MKFLLFFLCLVLFTGCGASGAVPEGTVADTESTPGASEAETESASAENVQEDPIQQMIQEMTTEEKVGQLFLARCDKTVAMEDISAYHLGGFVLFGNDFRDETPESIFSLTADYQRAARIPLLLAVDEEGGIVNRISQYPAFRSEPFPASGDVFAYGGLEGMLSVEKEKCMLLRSLGLNVNLGPVCDIATDPSAFMYPRSLRMSPTVTARAVSDIVTLMGQYQIGSTLKHFPGYGNNADTHVGIAVDSRSLEELEQVDLYPFRSGIAAGCGAIMVSHTIVEALDPVLPASLSPAVHGYLRENMGFTGVIMTDDLVMQAITDRYGAGEAAVMAVLAGNDLLCSTEYRLQYDAVLDAVRSGRIDMDTLDRAVRHVLEWKMALGLL